MAICSFARLAAAQSACPATFEGIRTKPGAGPFICKCTDAAAESGEVFGGNSGNYAPQSNVCRAAKHIGLGYDGNSVHITDVRGKGA